MKKNNIAMILALALGMSLTACGSSAQAPAATQAAEAAETEAAEAAVETEAAEEAPAELTTVDVVLDWYPNAVHTFLYEAADKGYFAEEGLEVNLISPAESIDAITFTATGRAQIGLTYPIDTITAYANEGMPVKAIGAISQSALGCMASLADTDITEDFSTLKGKKIGYSGTGAGKAQIDTITSGAGLTEADYELINVGFDLTTSLTTGSVDLVVGTFINDEIVTMRNAGYDVNVWKYQDYGVPQMYGLIMVANAEAMEADPAVYEGFIRACQKGFQDMIADEDAALELIMSDMNSDDNPLDEVQQRQSYEILLPLMQPENVDFLSMTEEVWQDTINWMYDAQLIDSQPAAADLFTNITAE